MGYIQGKIINFNDFTYFNSVKYEGTVSRHFIYKFICSIVESKKGVI